MRSQSTTKTVLITGASSGIGMALAPLFARDGYQLVLVARNEAALQDLARELSRDWAVACTGIGVLVGGVLYVAGIAFVYGSRPYIARAAPTAVDQ